MVACCSSCQENRHWNYNVVLLLPKFGAPSNLNMWSFCHVNFVLFQDLILIKSKLLTWFLPVSISWMKCEFIFWLRIILSSDCEDCANFPVRSAIINLLPIKICVLLHLIISLILAISSAFIYHQLRPIQPTVSNACEWIQFNVWS